MNTSPPSTSSSRPPENGEFRFRSITLPCEWVENYHPGGYHPVILGDVLNLRYKVIRKLGEGCFSTVWLAHDLKSSNHKGTTYVALKILVSKESESTTELRILHHIMKAAPTEGPRYITRLLDEFEHQGPNGVHKCLVFEPMGPNVNSMVLELPQFNPRKWTMKIRYPPQMAKSILKQSLQSIAFLHENGISHGDFQPGNILFVLDNVEAAPEDLLLREEDMLTTWRSAPVQRLDDKQDKWAPQYLYVAQPLVSPTCYSRGFKVKLSDMGGAYFFTDPPKKPITPIALRPPGLVPTGT
ncbi:unnamed protein product [Penicillium salamii]|uniref:non-specific serine/threonine protein kinase n=1 Tax=Penicillium salamii TaxID=1612424 RepID=A0A9W4MYN1_9EURO|nr:unnamed protein product [Penicillium salamii]